tara:strand:- start:624 stop:899 length:276 start_codon:yes stop_codon:yes gene_type:complete
MGKRTEKNGRGEEGEVMWLERDSYSGWQNGLLTSILFIGTRLEHHRARLSELAADRRRQEEEKFEKEEKERQENEARLKDYRYDWGMYHMR